jgi:hypothetical protein
MPTYEIRDSDHGFGSVLIPTSSWNADIEARLVLGNVDGVRLSYSGGFRGSDISFLSRFTDLRSIEIYSQEVRDLAPLMSLTQVKLLGLQTVSTFAFQSHWFPGLQVLLCQWRKGMDDLLSIPSLEYVNVINWPYGDLVALSKLRNLRRLSITSRKLTNLNGIAAIDALEWIDLAYCPHLVSVAHLEDCTRLKKVVIEACRHIPTRHESGRPS